MSCWDGPYPEQPEDEREGEWHDPEEADESWRGDEHLDDWPEGLAGPEYWFYRNEPDEDEEGR